MILAYLLAFAIIAFDCCVLAQFPCTTVCFGSTGSFPPPDSTPQTPCPFSTPPTTGLLRCACSGIGGILSCQACGSLTGDTFGEICGADNTTTANTSPPSTSGPTGEQSPDCLAAEAMTYICAGFEVLAEEVPTFCLLLNNPGVYVAVLTLLIGFPELAPVTEALSAAIAAAKELCLDEPALAGVFIRASVWCDSNEKTLSGNCESSQLNGRQVGGLEDIIGFNLYGADTHPQKKNAINFPNFNRRDVAPSNPCSFIADSIPNSVCNVTGMSLINNCSAALTQTQIVGINSTGIQVLQNACNAVSATMDTISQGLSGLCNIRTLLISQSQSNCTCPNAITGATINSTTCQIESCPSGMSVSSDGFSCSN